MAARAIWKGVVRFEDVRTPVKLYSAVEDRSVRFRLLERSTHTPVTQKLVEPETDEVVPYDATRRAFVTGDGDMVMLEPEDLDDLEPASSRDIDVVQFVPPEAIDHRWYVRPYYLGPDGDAARYAALAAALERTGREGVAHWTMRKKAYVGALRLHLGYPVLVTLRNLEEVVPLESVERPKAKPIDERQLQMAHQLIEMLAAPVRTRGVPRRVPRTRAGAHRGEARGPTAAASEAAQAAAGGRPGPRPGAQPECRVARCLRPPPPPVRRDRCGRARWPSGWSRCRCGSTRRSARRTCR